MWLIEIMITVSDFFILIFKVDRNLMWLYMRIEIQWKLKMKKACWNSMEMEYSDLVEMLTSNRKFQYSYC